MPGFLLTWTMSFPTLQVCSTAGQRRVLTVQEPMLLHCPVHRSPLKGLCSLTIWAHAAGLSTGC
nr:MAG TPA: hypothetical protein [Caudoviricetes sp.]